MKVMFDEEALEDLQTIFAWIAKDDLSAAKRLLVRIFDKVERLSTPELVRMGRFGRDPGTHELLEGPYIIVYEIHEHRDEVVLLSIVHSARERG